MYNITPEQKAASEKLEAQGFQFSNWVPASPDAEGNSQGDLGCMVFTKHPTKHSTHYREVDPQGNIN